MIDLHMHSTASDGQYTPKELVRKVKENNIKMMALTDHDTIDGVKEAVCEAEKLGIVCIPGIELSIEYPTELHILGLGIDINSKELNDACNRFVEERVKRIERIINFLHLKGMDITEDDIRKNATTDVIARPHVARAMVEKGYVKDTKEAFDKYLATDEFKKIDRKKVSVERGIDIIHKAGGYAALAHPVSLKETGEKLDSTMKKLKEAGLDGMEVYYSTHSDEQIAEYHSLAEKYGLFETIGADYHGEKVKPVIYLGKKENSQKPLAENEIQQRIFDEMLGRIVRKIS